MSRPIGFSTGAIAKGDFRRGLDVNRRAGAVEAVELSALREGELFALLEAIPSLDLSAFAYVSFHAPSKLADLDESALLEALRSLPPDWPIVAHPEVIISDAWHSLGARLCIENMDNRKTTGRTVDEMAELLERFPDAGFCLDVGHARQVDPTMNVAVAMLRAFRHRLRQLHVSEVGPQGEHLPMSRLAQIAFARLVRYLPEDCPIIIESIVPEEQIAAELAAVRFVFDRANAQQLREYAYA
jgi:hypothetical protein